MCVKSLINIMHFDGFMMQLSYFLCGSLDFMNSK